jgi:hypothetical protein
MGAVAKRLTTPGQSFCHSSIVPGQANKATPSSPIWGQLKLQRRTAAAIVEQFGHDPVQVSFATLRHGKIQVKVVRI